MNVVEQIAVLRDECLACRRCAIGGQTIEGFPSNVFSNMNCTAKVVVVGQNPGAEETRQGEPFVGKSGRFFDLSVASFIGLKRSDLYISNCLKCYTPGNRKPFQSELDNCQHFLDKEIEILKPKVIIALGGPAFTQLTGMSGIMKHHGETIFSPRYSTVVVPVLHPSPLNTNDPVKREMFFDDLRAVKEFLNEK